MYAILSPSHEFRPPKAKKSEQLTRETDLSPSHELFLSGDS